MARGRLGETERRLSLTIWWLSLSGRWSEEGSPRRVALCRGGGALATMGKNSRVEKLQWNQAQLVERLP